MPKAIDKNVIRVYPLLEPSHYMNNQKMLADVLFPDINVNAEQKFFSVSNAGFISYSDYSELWKENTKERKLPKDSAEAEKAALDFIQQAYARFKNKDKPEIRKNLVAFPLPAFQPVFETVSVLHPHEPGIDHWLCRYGTDLYWNAGTERIAIYGALIEIRVGDKNKIIGLNIRFRPVTSSGFNTTLFPFQDDEENEPHKKEKHQEPILVYVLETDNQKFLAPYYLTTDGHHAGFLPASEYSIVADILQENTATSANLYAMIDGGNRQKKISVDWTLWQPDKVFDEGVKSMGRSPVQNDITFGVYNVSLDITDDVNKQTKRFQKKVYIFSEADDKIAEKIQKIIDEQKPAV